VEHQCFTRDPHPTRSGFAVTCSGRALRPLVRARAFWMMPGEKHGKGERYGRLVFSQGVAWRWIVTVLDKVEERPVNAGVVAEFRVERRRHRLALTNYDGILALGSQNLYAGPEAFDFGCTYENHFDRCVTKQPFADGAVNLAAIGVAANVDVDRAESELLGILDFLGKENGAGTGAEGWFQAHKIFQLFETCLAEQLEECAGFPAGDHEAIDGIELFGLFDQHDVGAKFFQALAVGVEVALEGEDADGRWSSVVGRWQGENPLLFEKRC
jgi:hypothetical protein